MTEEPLVPTIGDTLTMDRLDKIEQCINEGIGLSQNVLKEMVKALRDVEHERSCAMKIGFEWMVGYQRATAVLRDIVKHPSIVWADEPRWEGSTPAELLNRARGFPGVKP